MLGQFCNLSMSFFQLIEGHPLNLGTTSVIYFRVFLCIFCVHLISIDFHEFVKPNNKSTIWRWLIGTT